MSGRGSVWGSGSRADPDVPRIAFTGSVEVGRRIQQQAATERVKVVTLGLGGKNPIIVFPDANRDEALAGVVRGMNFTWQGEPCGSTSRLYVHRSLSDEFLEDLVAALDAMVVGDPTAESTNVGAIVSEQRLRASVGCIEAGRAEPRARLLTGGIADVPGGGWFIRPTLFCTRGRRGNRYRRGRDLRAGSRGRPVRLLRRGHRAREPASLRVDCERLDVEPLTAMSAARILRRLGLGKLELVPHPGNAFGGVKDSGVGREEDIDEL